MVNSQESRVNGQWSIVNGQEKLRTFNRRDVPRIFTTGAPLKS